MVQLFPHVILSAAQAVQRSTPATRAELQQLLRWTAKFRRSVERS